MNRKKYGFVACLLMLIAVISIGATNIYVNQNEKREEENRLCVVTSFYPMYIAALNIVDGCEFVELENLSEPQTGCLHDYQLTPEDMVLISKADVFIVNGGGIENFLKEVAEQYPDLKIIEAGQGVKQEGENAHLWMSLENYQKQVENIAAGLADAAADWLNTQGKQGGRAESLGQSAAGVFEKNAEGYCARIQRLAEDYRDIGEGTGEKAVLFHEAFEYMAKEWGIEISYVLNLDEERQVSAGEAADVLGAVKEDGAELILAERLYGEELAESIRRESGIKILYLDTCVRGEYEKDAYLDAMEDNLKRLRKEMQPD